MPISGDWSRSHLPAPRRMRQQHVRGPATEIGISNSPRRLQRPINPALQTGWGVIYVIPQGGHLSFWPSSGFYPAPIHPKPRYAMGQGILCERAVQRLLGYDDRLPRRLETGRPALPQCSLIRTGLCLRSRNTVITICHISIVRSSPFHHSIRVSIWSNGLSLYPSGLVDSFGNVQALAKPLTVQPHDRVAYLEPRDPHRERGQIVSPRPPEHERRRAGLENTNDLAPVVRAWDKSIPFFSHESALATLIILAVQEPRPQHRQGIRLLTQPIAGVGYERIEMVFRHPGERLQAIAQDQTCVVHA